MNYGKDKGTDIKETTSTLILSQILVLVNEGKNNAVQNHIRMIILVTGHLPNII